MNTREKRWAVFETGVRMLFLGQFTEFISPSKKFVMRDIEQLDDDGSNSLAYRLFKTLLMMHENQSTLVGNFTNTKKKPIDQTAWDSFMSYIPGLPKLPKYVTDTWENIGGSDKDVDLLKFISLLKYGTTKRLLNPLPADSAMTNIKKLYEPVYEYLKDGIKLELDDNLISALRTEDSDLFATIISPLVLGAYENISSDKVAELTRMETGALFNDTIVIKATRSSEFTNAEDYYVIENDIITPPTVVLDLNDVFFNSDDTKDKSIFYEYPLVTDMGKGGKMVWLQDEIGEHFNANNIVSFGNSVYINLFRFLFLNTQEEFANDLENGVVKLSDTIGRYETNYTAWVLNPIPEGVTTEDVELKPGLQFTTRTLNLTLIWTDLSDLGTVKLDAATYEKGDWLYEATKPSFNSTQSRFGGKFSETEANTLIVLAVEAKLRRLNGDSIEWLDDREEAYQRDLIKRIVYPIDMDDDFLSNSRTYINTSSFHELPDGTKTKTLKFINKGDKSIYAPEYALNKGDEIRNVLTYWGSANKRTLNPTTLDRINAQLITHSPYFFHNVIKGTTAKALVFNDDTSKPPIITKAQVESRRNELLEFDYNAFRKKYESKINTIIFYVDATTKEPYDPLDNKFGSLVTVLSEITINKDDFEAVLINLRDIILNTNANDETPVYDKIQELVDDIQKSRSMGAMGSLELIFYHPIITVLRATQQSLLKLESTRPRSTSSSSSSPPEDLFAQTIPKLTWNDLSSHPVRAYLDNPSTRFLLDTNTGAHVSDMSDGLYPILFPSNRRTFTTYAVGTHDFRKDIVSRVEDANDIFLHIDEEELSANLYTTPKDILKLIADVGNLNQDENRPVTVTIPPLA